MAEKSSKLEVENRVSNVLGLILDGVASSEIVRQGSEQWGVGRRAIEKYITKAYKILDENARRKRRETIQWHLESRKRNLYRLVGINDYRGVAQQLKDMADLQGMYPKRQLEIETKNVPITRSEIITELEKFATKAGLALNDYLDREGISLEDIKGDTDEPDYSTQG